MLNKGAGDFPDQIYDFHENYGLYAASDASFGKTSAEAAAYRELMKRKASSTALKQPAAADIPNEELDILEVRPCRPWCLFCSCAVHPCPRAEVGWRLRRPPLLWYPTCLTLTCRTRRGAMRLASSRVAAAIA